jgi:hypothetical protein
MSVVRFPKQGACRQRTAEGCDDEVDSELGADDDTIPCHGDDESGFPDHGAACPAPFGGPFLGKPRQKKRRLSATAIIAHSLSPSNHTGGAAPLPSAVDIMARALCPSGQESTPELLRQSFWQVWLQHHDYLKKKASISSIDIARMPRMP